MKTRSGFQAIMFCVVALSVVGFVSPIMCADYPESIQTAMSEINSRSPKSYPKVITPLPEPGELSKKSIEELLKIADSWNPALSKVVSYELAARGDAILPLIKKKLASENSQERVLAATVTHIILKYQIWNSTKIFPKERSWRQAQPKVRKKHRDFIPLLLPLLKDPDRKIREAALRSLGELQAKQKDVSEAVLLLFGDPDEYLAQVAISTLSRNIGVEGVDQDTLFDAFDAGMKQPLPAGRGTIIKLISQQDKAFQKRCVPFLIKHMKWVPKRDAMGAASGQVEGIQILTSLKEESMLEHIPFLMNKKYRHHRKYLEESVKAASAYGSKAKPLLPVFKKTLEECEKELKEIEAKGVNRKTKTRFELLKKRAEVLRKAVKNVEK